MAGDQWYPAILTGVRADGKYEAEVKMPADEYGNVKKVHYPIVEAHRIRDPFTKYGVEVPSTMLCLAVKKDSALLPELTVNGHPFTSYICVPSPASNKPPAEINLVVKKDRTNLTADVGHGQMSQALDATKPGYKVRSKACQKAKLKCEWDIQIGAFGEHHIVIEKKSKSSKEVHLSIDGNLIVAGSAADLGGGEWSADIAIQGKLVLKYSLHKTTMSGAATDQTTDVTKKLLHSNTMRVFVPDLNNLETAVLECDEVEFERLQQHKTLPTESTMDDSLEVFESTHGISVPYAMDSDNSGGGLVADFADLATLVPGGSGLLRMFTKSLACCQQPAIDDDSQVVIGSANSQWKEGDKSTPVDSLDAAVTAASLAA
jgi:hypothetical protein